MRLWSWVWLLHRVAVSILLILLEVRTASSMLLLSSNCLTSWTGCTCSWKSGKFVADCASQGLNQVPNNDYYDHLQSNAGNNQMPTLNRDIQQLSLATNNITILKGAEFYQKKFRNLQKIYLNANQVTRVAASAFYKLTGLIELDLSENLISNIEDDEFDIAANQVSEANQPQQAAGGSTTVTSVDRNLDSTRGASNESAARVSFLQELTQLRQLNLASNRLSRLDKFTFTPLGQLRQLILSRNQISYIDKRAFDGLNVLNILHLDGNKLSHLDGDILFRLPQLYSLQLAGANPWRCDCRLRKLVRILSGPARGDGAQQAKILQDQPRCAFSYTLASDEEMDGGGDSPVAVASKDIGQHQWQPAASEDDTRPLWQNMKLGQFECPPELIGPLMPKSPPPNNDHHDNSLPAANNVTGKVMNMNDKMGGDSAHRSPAAAGPTFVRRRYEARHLAASEPIELTVAVAVTDELDLELVHVEWWQLDQQLRPNLLLWRSADQRQTTATAKTNGPVQHNTSSPAPSKDSDSGSPETVAINKEPSIKRRPQRKRQDYVVIDYVTRVNRSTTNLNRLNEAAVAVTETDAATRASSVNGSSSGEGSNDEELMGHSGVGGARSPLGAELKLIRVLHFVMDATAAPLPPTITKNNSQLELFDRNFLCRITNLAGRLEVVFTVQIDHSTGRPAQAEWPRRESAGEHRVNEFASGHIQHPLARWLAYAPGWSLEKAKALVAAEESNKHRSNDSTPLFVPLYLPEEVTKKGSALANDQPASEDTEASDKTETEETSVSPVARSQSQRPATRQTVNGSMALASTANQLSNMVEQPASQERQGTSKNYHSWSPIVQSLIHRYTSNKLSLIESSKMQQDSDDSLVVVDSLGSAEQAEFAEKPSNSLHSAFVRYIRTRYLDRWIHFAIGSAPLLLGLSAGLIVGCLLTVLLVLRFQCATNRVGQSSEHKRKAEVVAKNELIAIHNEEQDSPINSRSAKTDQQTQQLTSAGSSSSTTNGSQRKLIRNGAKTIATAKRTKNRRLLAGSSDSDRYQDSSCQSDEGELDADLEDSIDSQPVGGRSGVNWTDNVRPHSSTSSGSNNNINSNGTMTSNQHRLIVVNPQQEMQELLVAAPSPFYLATSDVSYGQRYAIDQISEADSSLITYHCGPVNVRDSSLAASKLSIAPNGLYSSSPSQWPHPSCELEDSQSSSSALNTSSHIQQFIPLVYQSKPRLGRAATGGTNSVRQDARYQNNTTASDKQPDGVYQISAKVGPSNVFELSQSGTTNRETYTSFASPNRNHQLNSSSSITSNSPSQSQQLQIDRRHQNLYRQCSDLQEHIENPNIVYLEDALRLLHTSMSDCLMLRDDDNGVNNRM